MIQLPANATVVVMHEAISFRNCGARQK